MEHTHLYRCAKARRARSAFSGCRARSRAILAHSSAVRIVDRPAPGDAGQRQVVGLSPRQVLDPPSIFPPGVHDRREDGGLACVEDANRYDAASALPSSSIIRGRAPVLRSFEADAGPRDGRGDEGRIECPGAVRGAVCAGPISGMRFTCEWSSARLRLAVRTRGEAPDQPDGVALLAHAHTRQGRACAPKTPPARSHAARGSGCSGIGRGVGFAYMTVPAGQRGPAQSAPTSFGLPRAHVPFPTAQAPRKKLLPVSTSAAATPWRPNRSILPSSLPAFRSLLY
jgi:hypothetical protein